MRAVAGWDHDVVVVITIRVDEFDPPAGWVVAAGGVERRFVGWLGLLRVLSDVLATSDR
jgi:hypothetical protein